MSNFKTLCYEEKEFNLKALMPHLGDFLPFEAAPKLRDLELRLASNAALCGLFRPHIIMDDAHNYFIVEYVSSLPSEELGKPARHMSRLVPMPPSSFDQSTLYVVAMDLRKGNPIDPALASSLLDDESALVEVYELLGKFSLTARVVNGNPFFRGKPAYQFFKPLFEGLKNNYKKAFGCFYKSASSKEAHFASYYNNGVGISTSWVNTISKDKFAGGFSQLKYLLHAYEAGCIPIGVPARGRGVSGIYSMHRINNAKGYTRENTIFLPPAVHSEVHVRMHKEGLVDSLPILLELGYLPLLERYNPDAQVYRQLMMPAT